jgi:Cu-Zn family superoxide dismutase
VRGDSVISGTITFEQYDEIAPTTITWHIRGNDPNSERGFHIHEFGDNTNGCTSAGPHCMLYTSQLEDFVIDPNDRS